MLRIKEESIRKLKNSATNILSEFIHFKKKEDETLNQVFERFRFLCQSLKGINMIYLFN